MSAYADSGLPLTLRSIGQTSGNILAPSIDQLWHQMLIDRGKLGFIASSRSYGAGSTGAGCRHHRTALRSFTYNSLQRSQCSIETRNASNNCCHSTIQTAWHGRSVGKHFKAGRQYQRCFVLTRESKLEQVRFLSAEGSYFIRSGVSIFVTAQSTGHRRI